MPVAEREAKPDCRRLRRLLSLVWQDPEARRLAGRLARRLAEVGAFPTGGHRTPEQSAAARRDVGCRELELRLRGRVYELAAEQGLPVEI